MKFKWGNISTELRSERGNILVLTALSMTFLCGLLALVVDVGHLLYTRRHLQTLADAAALAGSLELNTCGSTANCSALQTAAKASMTENGISDFSTFTNCSTGTATGMTLTINNGPCALGSNDPNYNNVKYVEAQVSYPVKSIFGNLLGKKSFTLNARAEAGGGQLSPCVYVLDPTAGSALTMNGNDSLLAPTCSIIVDSNSTSAAMFDGHVTVTSKSLNIVGGDTINGGSNSITPSPTTGASAVADPLSSLPAPPVNCSTNSTGSPYYGRTSNLSINQDSVFYPGCYAGGINLNGQTSATFKPGIYVFTGDLNVGTGSISGNGVMFYFTNYSTIQMNGNSSANLVAPTTGTYAGILIYQDRKEPADIKLNGGSSNVWQGVLYAPAAQLTLNGGSNLAAYTFLVVNQLLVDGNVNFTVGTDYSSLPNGSPIPSTGGALVE